MKLKNYRENALITYRTKFTKEEFGELVHNFFKKAEEERKERLKREEEQSKADFKFVKDFFIRHFEVTEEEMDLLCLTEEFAYCFSIFCLVPNACINKAENIMTYFSKAIDKMKKELIDKKLKPFSVIIEEKKQKVENKDKISKEKQKLKSEYINKRGEIYGNISRYHSKRKL
jgi:hypothetical protein|nr:MAG TPA: hypothetical protein [Caudoviricetes sp.]